MARSSAPIPDRASELFSLGLSEKEWLERASKIMLGDLQAGAGEGWLLVWEAHGPETQISAAVYEGERARRMVFEFPAATLPDVRDRVAKSGLTTVTAAGLWTPDCRDLFHEMRCEDAIGASCANDDAGLVAGRLLERKAPHPPLDRGSLAPTMRAIVASWRVRRWLSRADPVEAAEAIFTVDGAVVHACGAATTPSALGELRARVLARERARSAVAKSPSGRALWSDLVRGRWSLLDDYERGGKRYILAIRNDAYADAFALAPAEARIIELFALGRSAKSMVDILGVSLAQVYALQARLLRKLSLRSMADVVALARQLPVAVLSRVNLDDESMMALRLPAAAQDLSLLTAAERDVARDLLLCLSQKEIARRRGRSPRTIANQVGTIYRKLQVTNRSEFVARLRMGKAVGRHLA